MSIGARLFKTYVTIFIVFWLALAVVGLQGLVGTVEIRLFSGIALGAGVYCTWRILRTRSAV